MHKRYPFLSKRSTTIYEGLLLLVINNACSSYHILMI